MDTLDIYELPDDTRVIVTIEELCELFVRGIEYGEMDVTHTAHHVDRTIKGEIV